MVDVVGRRISQKSENIVINHQRLEKNFLRLGDVTFIRFL